MKKTLVITIICLAIIILLPKIVEALIVFLLAGQLPVVNLSISPTVIYVGSVLAGCGLAAHFIITLLEQYIAKRQKQASTTVRKVALPAHRYHRLHS